jgi:hypothetical protein
MSNRLLKYIILISAALVIVFYAAFSLSDYPELFSWINYAGQIFILTSVYFLAKNGSFIRTKQFNLVGPAIATIIVGVLFKIMHWPHATYALMLGAGVLVFSYAWYVLQHQSLRTHALKLLFVAAFVGGRIMSVFHWPYGYELMLGSLVLLLIVIVPALRKVQ